MTICLSALREEVRAGVITSPLDITDAWKNSYPAAQPQSMGCEITARHPNLVALEMSSFNATRRADLRRD